MRMATCVGHYCLYICVEMLSGKPKTCVACTNSWSCCLRLKIGAISRTIRISCFSWEENPIGQQWACSSDWAVAALWCGAWLFGESLSDQPGPLACEFATLDPEWQFSNSDVAIPHWLPVLGGLGWSSERQRLTVCSFLPLSFKWDSEQ